MRLFRRRKERLRAIGEAEAYGHAYGDRSEDVRLVKRVVMEPRRPRLPARITGEELRRRFAERLDRRGEPTGNGDAGRERGGPG